MKSIQMTALLAGLCFTTFISEAQTWMQAIAPNQHWQSIASSTDGTKLVAVADNNNGNTGVIYTSTNSGINWMLKNAPNLTWNFVASSADGNCLAATVYNGGVYTSTNAGNNWTESSADISSWSTIASSADGTRLFAGGGEIETSTNAGGTWTTNDAPFGGCTSIACSANGSNLVAGSMTTGNVYTSTNSGATWILATNVTMNTGGWVSVASSADGTRLVAMGQASNSLVYVSANAGVTWTSPSTSPENSEDVTPIVASSADGSHLAVALASVGVYFSTNYGGTWSTTGTIPSGTVAFSANGGELLASVYGGGIYVLQLPISPSIYLMQAVEPVFSNLLIGTNYQLQVSPNLSSWTNSGSAFTATNSTMIYPQYFDVANWSQLYFRLQVAP
jgi:hypothetical protein